MKTILMNMVRIFDENQVLVLDKKKKYGWEGLTFPGGKVEAKESLNQSAIREIKEETNLDIKNLKFDGIIQWIDLDEDLRMTGLLYSTRDFSGNLIEDNEEGTLYFQDYNSFKETKGKSDSMDIILDIYDGKYFEVVLTYKEGKLIKEEYIG